MILLNVNALIRLHERAQPNHLIQRIFSLAYLLDGVFRICPQDLTRWVCRTAFTLPPPSTDFARFSSLDLRRIILDIVECADTTSSLPATSSALETFSWL